MLLHSVNAELSNDVLKGNIPDIVLVHLWVEIDGLPSHVRMVRSVSKEIDEKVVEAVKQYRFKPATEKGNPVVVEFNVEYRLK